MLVVISLIIVLMSLAVPAINTMKSGSDFSQAAYDMGGYLDQARSYAVANNTYVFVGITEVDGLKDDATLKASGSAGVGRVVMVSAASKDGTKGYTVSGSTVTVSLTSWPAGLTAIGKPLTFDNVHLMASLGAGTGRMQRVGVTTAYRIGDTTNISTLALKFGYPIGLSATDANARYWLTRVLSFDPQGALRYVYASGSGAGDSLPSQGYIEIGMIPSHGNATVSPITNQAALLFDCMSGNYRVYRP
ncbi:MAG: hypothetical protein QM796_08365 [Chthoniobacteraceae bacterium]